jgi:hypothetical protein
MSKGKPVICGFGDRRMPSSKNNWVIGNGRTHDRILGPIFHHMFWESWPVSRRPEGFHRYAVPPEKFFPQLKQRQRDGDRNLKLYLLFNPGPVDSVPD